MHLLNLNSSISRLRTLEHQRPAQDRISPQQLPHAVRLHDPSGRTSRRENTRSRTRRPAGSASKLAPVDGGQPRVGRHGARDAARLARARATPRACAGTDGAYAVRA